MNCLNCKLAVVLGAIVVPIIVASAKDMTDPYEILEQHYAALGGIEKLKAEDTSYLEADFVLVGAGLEGKFRRWGKSPVKERQELDLKVLRQTSGDNGETAWVVDTNGKLKILRDQETEISRQLRKLMAEFAHLDRDSSHFSLSCEGVEEIESVPCYSIRISNNLDASEQVLYINKDTFLMEKSVIHGTDGGETHTTFSDYRPVDGVLRSFKQRTDTVPTHQVQEITVTLLQANTAIADELFNPPAESADDFHFTSGSSSEDVDFLFHENHIYMEVTVNCDKQLWVLDSGAGMTVIDRQYADGLGLVSEGNIKGQGVNNVVDMALVKIPGLQVDGVRIDEQQAISIDLGRIFDQLSDLKVAGILGYDFLSRFVSKIDYANQKISLYHPDTFSYSGDGSALDAPLNDMNMFTIPMTVEGKFAGQWRFDTGASGTGFHYDFAETNGLLNRPGIERQSFGAGGSHVSRQVRFTSASIGGYELPPLVISVPFEKGHGALAEKSLIGNLGSNVFRHFVVFLDYKRQQIILEKGDDFGKEFTDNNSGLQFWYPGGEKRVEIRFVAPGTAGDRAGLKVNDRVMAVNGIDVESLDGLHAMNELMKAAPGTRYRISILREATELELDLTLMDPFK